MRRLHSTTRVSAFLLLICWAVGLCLSGGFAHANTNSAQSPDELAPDELAPDELAPDELASGQLSERSIRDALSRALELEEYQTELPERSSFDPEIDLGGGGGLFPLGTILIYLLIAVVVAALAILAVNYFQQPREVTAKIDTPKPAQVSDAPLGDAEQLAREGRFGEAIHVLLLRTIEELRDSLAFLPSPSLTSREINVIAPLTSTARETLGDLITEVELSYFGDRPVDREQYDVCVRLFKTFVNDCRTGAARG